MVSVGRTLAKIGESPQKPAKMNMLSFAFFYFSEAGLFRHLRSIQLIFFPLPEARSRPSQRGHFLVAQALARTGENPLAPQHHPVRAHSAAPDGRRLLLIHDKLLCAAGRRPVSTKASRITRIWKNGKKMSEKTANSPESLTFWRGRAGRFAGLPSIGSPSRARLEGAAGLFNTARQRAFRATTRT
jgi:hypothetical protein